MRRAGAPSDDWLSSKRPLANVRARHDLSPSQFLAPNHRARTSRLTIPITIRHRPSICKRTADATIKPARSQPTLTAGIDGGAPSKPAGARLSPCKSFAAYGRHLVQFVAVFVSTMPPAAGTDETPWPTASVAAPGSVGDGAGGDFAATSVTAPLVVFGPT